jgi:hypothetical protein
MHVRIGPGVFKLEGPAVDRAYETLCLRLSDYICVQETPGARCVFIETAFEPIFQRETASWRTDEVSFALEFTVFAAQGPLSNTDTIQAKILDHNEPEELLADRIIGLVRSLATELWRSQAVLAFHGASVELINGLGVLVIGHSGKGKTTFATGPWIRLRRSDDHAMILFSKEYEMPGVPFQGREQHSTTPGSSALDCIIVPTWRKGHQAQIKPLSKADSVEYLLKNLLCIDARSESFETNIRNVEKLISNIPVYSLDYDADQVGPGLASQLALEINPVRKAS